jgi:hypothetical protein
VLCGRILVFGSRWLLILLVIPLQIWQQEGIGGIESAFGRNIKVSRGALGSRDFLDGDSQRKPRLKPTSDLATDAALKGALYGDADAKLRRKADGG